MIYHNYPLSNHRPPSNQFLRSPSARFDHPVVAIITATNNPRRSELLETASSLFGQSLQNFVWIIVDDHTDVAESLAVLKELAASDSRIRLIRNLGFKGLSQGRNTALKHLFERPELPKYIIPLDDDDLFELTALEKITWMMESNPDWSIGGFYYVKWGEGANETVTTGLHDHKENWLRGNFVPNAAIYRTGAVLESGCRYDEEGYANGGEDWDFWMCLADSGFWGGTAQEILYWYRANSPSFREQRWGNTFKQGSESTFLQLREQVQSKHHHLANKFPSAWPKRSVSLEPITWDSPFQSGLAATDKSITFIFPWLYLGGADIGALHMVQIYAEAGYRVTVICTLFKSPAGIELRPEFLKWTHDLHILPAMMRPVDFPRYIKHLITSRGSQEVIFSNSQLIYEMLPALVEQLPEVKFIDYLHNEAYDGWKSGGYPRYSLIAQRYLARTITCSHYLKNWLVREGHLDPSRIGVVKLGVDIRGFAPPTNAQRTLAKAKMLSIPPSVLVITFVGRLCDQKRATLLPLIIRELLEHTAEDMLLVIIGEGDKRNEIIRLIDGMPRTPDFHMEDYIRLLGPQTNVRDYLEATDIFLLPSLSEGISIAVAEAMAMGIPVVTANAGALPEQLGFGTAKELGGALVDATLDDRKDTLLYVQELASLIAAGEVARARVGAAARRVVEAEAPWQDSLKGLFTEVDRASNLEEFRPRLSSKLPHPAAYSAVQTLLLEQRELMDQLGSYPNAPI